MTKQDSFDQTLGVTRAAVVHPYFKVLTRDALSTPEARLDEAVGLALAIDLEVVVREVIVMRAPRPATLIGQGQVEMLAGALKSLEVDVVIVDASLSPIQQRNLEKAWGCKVIDRTGLILEIFGARARTAEGRLQVELAALTYQKSRLVRSWTHLERQRGSLGFIGGPGETQLEIDRRLISERIGKIKRELTQVKRTRALHRHARKRVPFPIVALVGYTNAGKSTLFNRLTQANVFAEDLLFATLDPTMRHVKLPGGQEIILSDTVGFISELPTQLIAAFRATLEEVLEADLILHVRDGAHPSTDQQKRDVLEILEELGLGERLQESLIEVCNKIDLMDTVPEGAVGISALTGEGIPALLTQIEQALTHAHAPVELEVPVSNGAALAWLYQHGDVVARHDGDEVICVTVRLSAIDRARYETIYTE